MIQCWYLFGKGASAVNIDHLRYFLILAQENHYSRAAQRLNISQSGLSHAIAALEAELGLPLFQKRGRGIELGPYGAALLPQAQQIVTLADHCVRSFQMLRDGVGVIRLRTIPQLITPTVAKLCRLFKEENPDTDFSFTTGMSSEVCQSLLSGEADIGFCSKPLEDPALEYVPIQKRRMVAVVPLDHPLAARQAVRLAETLPYPHVTYSWRSGQRDAVDRIFAPVRQDWQIAYEVEDANFILELVAQGFGITVMLETPPVYRNDVKVLSLTDAAGESKFYIARRKQRSPIPSVGRFFAFCAAQTQGAVSDEGTEENAAN